MNWVTNNGKELVDISNIEDNEIERKGEKMVGFGNLNRFKDILDCKHKSLR